MTLGDKISKLRKDNNYTQEQLAGILEYPDSLSANGKAILPTLKQIS